MPALELQVEENDLAIEVVDRAEVDIGRAEPARQPHRLPLEGCALRHEASVEGKDGAIRRQQRVRDLLRMCYEDRAVAGLEQLVIVDVGPFPLHLQDRVGRVFAAAEQEVPQIVRVMIL